MDLGPRWLALAAALAFVLGGGAMLLPAQASSPPQALVLAAADDDDDDDDDDGEARSTGRRDRARERTGDQAPARRREDDVRGIPGLEARDPERAPGSYDAGDRVVRAQDDVPRRAEILLDGDTIGNTVSGTVGNTVGDGVGAGGYVGPLVLAAILGTGVLVGATYWFSRRFGP
ncbi:hypothetical protein ACFFV7_02210 [Nonomuraea spiralis]|uniref:Uncharacterized protein n=1 Tax=Nonomuraea spiralis TaxID=46182 RepID=A0ABV5I888_9ACTN|nr:hypothetical protein [Nonomuraea spiralis]GGS65091.1 hypothetical protein GCM10010176_004430 [Nonomuraea spiralis]